MGGSGGLLPVRCAFGALHLIARYPVPGAHGASYTQVGAALLLSQQPQTDRGTGGSPGGPWGPHLSQPRGSSQGGPSGGCGAPRLRRQLALSRSVTFFRPPLSPHRWGWLGWFHPGRLARPGRLLRSFDRHPVRVWEQPKDPRLTAVVAPGWGAWRGARLGAPSAGAM